MKILALDTASDVCAVALYVAGETHWRQLDEPRAHGRVLLSMVSGLLADHGLRLADLDALACGRGPGSFTGVRIAVAAAQGLAFGADLPVVPVSSLAALAQGVWREQGAQEIAVAVDARMGEVYWGTYRADGDAVIAAGAERVCAPGEVTLPAGEWVAAGSGWDVYADALPVANVVRVMAPRLVDARDLVPLALRGWRDGLAVEATALSPEYLRNEVAWQKA